MIGVRGSAALVTLLLASACAGPRSAPPAAAGVTPPAGWRTSLAAGQPVSTDWWRSFGDPVLTTLIERALANNVDIAVAAARVEEARATERLARAQLSPQIGGALPTSDGRALNPFGVATTNLAGQPALTASYDLDLFGRLRLASEAARAQLLATAAARDTVRLGIVGSIASGYITLRALDARLLVARETLAARAEALR
ncbi:MAG TPA: TolC family protein, partial [Sphingomonas sp.]